MLPSGKGDENDGTVSLSSYRYRLWRTKQRQPVMIRDFQNTVNDAKEGFGHFMTVERVRNSNVFIKPTSMIRNIGAIWWLELQGCWWAVRQFDGQQTSKVNAGGGAVLSVRAEPRRWYDGYRQDHPGTNCSSEDVVVVKKDISHLFVQKSLAGSRSADWQTGWIAQLHWPDSGKDVHFG